MTKRNDHIHQIDPRDAPDAFPDVETALQHPDGLLAFGGDLSTPRLVQAYHRGIFPWFSDGQPILWWSPDPRTVLFPEQLKVSRSLRRSLRKQRFQVTMDQAFRGVVEACAAPRSGASGTWITRPMAEAYCRLHEDGVAHSVECWNNERLAGGLYGVALGRVFFGESMFSHETDASKVALVHLVQRLLEWHYVVIDCQVTSDHLLSLGAESIPRSEFCTLINEWSHVPSTGPW